MRWIVAIAMLAAPTAAVAQEQQRFNLVCQGQEQLVPGGRKKQIERVYRVDLQRQVWCIEECNAVQPIAEITDAQIVFQVLDRYGMQVPHWVSRTSGVVRQVGYHGQCVRAPFTEITAKRF